jgi:hypothetical protein
LPENKLNFTIKISQTLTRFLSQVNQTRHMERTLLVKRFIPRIDYSKTQIAVNLDFSGGFSRNETEGAGVGQAGGVRVETKKPQENFPCGYAENQFDGERQVAFALPARTTVVVWPSGIHACKRKDI